MDLLAKLHFTRRSIAWSGYVCSDRMIRREPGGRQYFCLVAMKTVSAIHLEVAERVDFCFDLMLMLRAMMDNVRGSRSTDRSR